MKRYFGYVRVSTPKQGEGVSLEEQRDAIERYAQRANLPLTQWFEETQTAAKRGRPVFNRMMKLLNQRKAEGVIIHKIDRSARNLKDWADLGELIDCGVEVHFANESLDLLSRGGRLSADIQAVVAADYVRNLREETRKGFYGRLKQGFYPLPAPLGYLDQGKAKPKEFDPDRADLVREAFELYATGRYNLRGLVDELWRRGLRNRRGSTVTLPGLAKMLNNPFYMGLIRLRSTGETFPGTHQPLISKSLFDRVHAILTGKTNTRAVRHDFTYRRLLKCKWCGYTLIGEIRKGFTYYRCHTRDCQTNCLREERVQQSVLALLARLTFTQEEKIYLASKLADLRRGWTMEREKHLESTRLNLDRLSERLQRLTDAYIDRLIDKDLFEHRKNALLMEKRAIEERLAELTNEGASLVDQLARDLELAETASSAFNAGLPPERRDLLRLLTSNCVAADKQVDFTLRSPFYLIADRPTDTKCGPSRNIPRTLDSLLERMVASFNGSSDQLRPAA